MTPEGKVKAEVKAWLKARGAYFFMPVQTGYGVSTLDFLCCLNGRFVGIEAKSPRGWAAPTPRQTLVIKEIIAAGGIAGVVKSIADLEALFEPPHASEEFLESLTAYGLKHALKNL